MTWHNAPPCRCNHGWQVTYARVAELVDALDLGSSVLRREGSTPSSRTIHVNALHYWGALIFCTYLIFLSEA